jgi:hypothetical protein
MIKKRILICTVIALSSGFFGGLMAAQITSMLHNQKCQTQGWGFQQVCNVVVTPGAIWQGSIAGIWTGTILGAFVGGSIVRKNY